MKPITIFIQDQLIPAMFERIDRIFPEMCFTKSGNRWLSSKRLDGSSPARARKDKCVITSRIPHSALENSSNGESINLINLYGRFHNLNTEIGGTDLIQAVKEISEICGLNLPDIDDDTVKRLKEYQEKQMKLESLAKQMANELLSEQRSTQAQAVYNYLREWRGYTDPFIEEAQFGVVSTDSARELASMLSSTPTGLGERFLLSVPYRSCGYIKGFLFRSISATDSDKYRCVFISEESKKRYNMFGLPGLKLSGFKEKDHDICVVEGELDALHCQYCDIPNVVAASGGSLYEEALKAAKKQGVRRVTLLYDRGEDNDNKKEKAISIIQKEGLSAFVASFPEGEGKMDADLFLKTHQAKELIEIIDAAKSAPVYLAEKALKDFQGEIEKGISDKRLHELKSIVFDLYNNQHTTPSDRRRISEAFSHATGLALEDIIEEAESLKEEIEAKHKKEELSNLANDIIRKVKNDDIEGAIETVKSKSENLRNNTLGARFNSFTSTVSMRDYLAGIADKPEAIGTGYYLFGDNGKTEFELSTGALTYICGQTSHGKTRMMENLAVNVANNGKEGEVLYISYEEEKTDIFLQMLNIYQGQVLARQGGKTIDVLRGYLKTRERSPFREDANIPELDSKIAEFGKLIDNGKLRPESANDIDGNELSIDGLCESILSAHKSKKLKAVFVDYAQLIYDNDSRQSRKDELAKICRKLMSLSKATQLAIVLGAQLNREAQGPTDLDVKQIADASNLEHSANKVLLIWNSSAVISSSSSFYVKGDKSKLSNEAQNLCEIGFTPDRSGKIYAVLAKNRGGARYEKAIFDFEGRTGKITQESNFYNKKTDSIKQENKERISCDDFLSKF